MPVIHISSSSCRNHNASPLDFSGAPLGQPGSFLNRNTRAFPPIFIPQPAMQP